MEQVCQFTIVTIKNYYYPQKLSLSTGQPTDHEWELLSPDRWIRYSSVFSWGRGCPYRVIIYKFKFCFFTRIPVAKPISWGGALLAKQELVNQTNKQTNKFENT